MQNYKMVISYDGTRFNGWQKQKNSKNTIQELLEQVLSELTAEKIEITASGRTDAGVHAYAQVINFNLKTPVGVHSLMEKINNKLPGDIAVRFCEEADERFHARYNAKVKIYEYRILNHPCHDPFTRKYAYQYPTELDIQQMRKGALFLIGSHDFKGFSSVKKSNKSTVRALGEIDIRKQGREIVISYTGDGFLYNMVRILTGTLIEIGAGERAPESIKTVFETGNRELAGFTVPPHGLFLKEVIY